MMRKEDNLIKYSKTKWKGVTKVVRIPVEFEQQIMDYAHMLENTPRGDMIDIKKVPVTDLLQGLWRKISDKEKGYRSNSASKLIAELKEIMDTIDNL